MVEGESEADQIERVARVICAAKWAGRMVPPWEILSDDEREVYRRMARAAIEALKA
jgi:hypothetical protein